MSRRIKCKLRIKMVTGARMNLKEKKNSGNVKGPLGRGSRKSGK